MGTEQVVALFRHTLQMALLMGAPLLFDRGVRQLASSMSRRC